MTYTSIRDLLERTRSYRRFDGSVPVPREALERWIGLTRLCGAASNIQPFRYIPITDVGKCAGVYETLTWAGHFPDWEGPVVEERPTAYIVMVGDSELTKKFWCDDGMCAQAILLGATEEGYGGCMLGAMDKALLRNTLSIPRRYRIRLVVALGRPVEEVKLVDVKDGDIRYYRDDDGVHHVPKRPLSELIVDFTD